MRLRERLNEKTMAERARETERKLPWMPSLASLLLPHREISRDAEEKAARTPVPIACGSRVTSHNHPKWGAYSRATCYGELLREKTKQCIQFSMNLGRVFVFYNPPPPRWNEEPLQSHLKKARKSYPDLKCICVRNNKNFNYQQILPLLFLHVVASFLDF